jgi:hypothetical protein
MNLVERYLAAICRELPRRNADEIVAELKDVLLSKIEDQEADLGRPLTDKEIEQMLIAFGHPLIVAGAYRKTQYLIGPEMFPFWLATMRTVLMIGGAILLVSILVSAADVTAAPVFLLQRVLHAAWPAFIWAFGVVTLVFAFNERMGRYRIGYKWTPRQLPPARSPGRKRFDMMAEIGAALVMILWWTGLIRFRQWLPAPPSLDIHLSAAWAPFHGALIAFWAASILINLVALSRPGWVRLNAGVSLAKNIAGCTLSALILSDGPLVEAAAPNLPVHALEMIARGFDKGLRLALLAGIAVLAVKAVLDGRRLWRAQQEGGRAGGGGSSPAAVRTA